MSAKRRAETRWGARTPLRSSSAVRDSTRARSSRDCWATPFIRWGRVDERLGQLLALTAESRVLDAASGKGTSAVLIAQRFGCEVVGVDLSAQNVAHATAEADRLGLAGRVRFRVGDAERLPLDEASVDAVICECAFCTFPDKRAAAQEFARVLKPGGRVGLSDITREPGPAGELADLMAWVACLADACPAAT